MDEDPAVREPVKALPDRRFVAVGPGNASKERLLLRLHLRPCRGVDRVVFVAVVAEGRCVFHDDARWRQRAGEAGGMDTLQESVADFRLLAQGCIGVAWRLLSRG